MIRQQHTIKTCHHYIHYIHYIYIILCLFFFILTCLLFKLDRPCRVPLPEACAVSFPCDLFFVFFHSSSRWNCSFSLFFPIYCIHFSFLRSLLLVQDDELKKELDEIKIEDAQIKEDTRESVNIVFIGHVGPTISLFSSFYNCVNRCWKVNSHRSNPVCIALHSSNGCCCFHNIITRFLTGMIDKRTIERCEKDAKDTNKLALLLGIPSNLGSFFIRLVNRLHRWRKSKRNHHRGRTCQLWNRKASLHRFGCPRP